MSKPRWLELDSEPAGEMKLSAKDSLQATLKAEKTHTQKTPLNWEP